MPHGVHVFEIVEQRQIRPYWIRDVLGVSTQRYERLKAGRVLFTREEANKLAKAFREVHGVEPHQLFDWDADILPPGRQRRSKGTVSKPEQHIEHTEDIAS